jgi:hypothetical protein
MQQVKYINPRGDEVVFDSTLPYIFEKISGTGAEDAQLITASPAAQDGTLYQGLYLSDREITLTIHIGGGTRAEMYENRQALIALLSTTYSAKGTLGRFEYTNDYGTWWLPALCKRGPQNFDRVANWQKSVQLVFYCPSPYWRSVDTDGDYMAYQGGGFEFPLEISSEEGGVEFGQQGYKSTLYNYGDSPAPLTITITGPATQPQITKTNTGEYLRIKRSLAAGDILTINTEPGSRSVVIDRESGVQENAFGYVDMSSTFLQLSPGENPLEYNSGDDSQTGRITVRAYSWFGGV